MGVGDDVNRAASSPRGPKPLDLVDEYGRRSSETHKAHDKGLG
jgi:hypothetical protein